MLRQVMGTAVVAIVLAAAASGVDAADKKYTFALVPKNTNNPFFDQALAGCKKAEKELNGAVECLYIGPGEHGGGDEQAQIVADLITKKVDGIAVSPANAAAMAAALQGAGAAKIPVLTWDSDLLEKDKALRIAYVGTHNYEIGVNLAKLAQQIKPQGGTICIQSGGAAAANHNERMQGIRDTLSGKKSGEAPGERLTGQNGWKEVDGCPLYTNDDFAVANQQMEDILNKYPELDAFIPTGGFPQFLPDAFTKTAEKVKDKIASGKIALVVADTLPVQIELMKKGSRLARSASGRSRWATRRCISSRTSRRARRRPPIRPIPASTSARRRPPRPASAGSPIERQHLQPFPATAGEGLKTSPIPPGRASIPPSAPCARYRRRSAR